MTHAMQTRGERRRRATAPQSYEAPRGVGSRKSAAGVAGRGLIVELCRLRALIHDTTSSTLCPSVSGPPSPRAPAGRKGLIAEVGVVGESRVDGTSTVANSARALRPRLSASSSTSSSAWRCCRWFRGSLRGDEPVLDISNPHCRAVARGWHFLRARRRERTPAPRSCQSLADVLRCRRSSPRINAW